MTETIFFKHLAIENETVSIKEFQDHYNEFIYTLTDELRLTSDYISSYNLLIYTLLEFEFLQNEYEVINESKKKCSRRNLLKEGS